MVENKSLSPAKSISAQASASNNSNPSTNSSDANARTHSNGTSSSVNVAGTGGGHYARRRKGLFDYTSVEPRNFLPPPLQVKLYDEAKSHNLIICLENDFGKTFIITKLIDHFAFDFRRKHQQMFCALLDSNMDSLIKQATIIRNHIDVNVAVFDANAITKDKLQDHSNFWSQQLCNANVLALAPALLLQILQSHIIELEQLNLIAFNNIHLHLNDVHCLGIMKLYEQLGTENHKPRIIGLSASILEGRIGYSRLSDLVNHLEVTFHSRIRTFFNFYSRPREIIYEYERHSYDVIESNNFDHLIDMITSFLEFMQQANIKCKPDWPLQLSKLSEYFENMLYVMEHMGLWCAFMLTDIYAYELSAIVSVYMQTDFTYASAVSAAFSLFNYTRTFLHEILRKYSKYEQLIRLSSRKMYSVIDTLIKLNEEKTAFGIIDIPQQPQKSGGGKRNRISDDVFNCVIFCQKRIVVRLLTLFIQEMNKWAVMDCLFMKADYILGNGKQTDKKKMDSGSRRRQEDALLRFRKNEINILVASFLEERLDIPKSSAVIAFDMPQTTKQYIQIKERTRNESSQVHFLLEKGSSELSLLFDLCNQNALMSNKCKDEMEKLQEKEHLGNLQFDEAKLLPEFVPDEKLITANSSNAIAIVNRYCLKLPSDSFTKLFPQCQVMYLADQQFICRILLPINSPLRYPIYGSIMPTQKLAKKSCAIEACRQLYQHGELDEHLLPVGKESPALIKALGLDFPHLNEADELMQEARSGTTKKRRYYDKRVARILQGPTIQPEQECFLYIISMKLSCAIPEEQNTRGRRIIDPADYSRCFAVLINRKLPKLCAFPVFTRSGEVFVDLKEVSKTISFTAEQIQRLTNFHKFTFKDVLQLERYPMKFDINESNCCYLLVPVDYDIKKVDNALQEAEIDWSFIQKVENYDEEKFEQNLAAEKFVFDRSVYKDAVVRPWYRKNETHFYFYVAEICDDLQPSSEFPDQSHATFNDYYQSKYRVRITDQTQPLLDVDHTSARLNLLTPRYVNRKGITLPMSSERTKKEKRDNLVNKQILIPELCLVHPFPASFWQKAVCIPCILYRINYLLLADELRYEVALSTKIGKLQLCDNEQWPQLDFGWTLAEVLEKSSNDTSPTTEPSSLRQSLTIEQHKTTPSSTDNSPSETLGNAASNGGNPCSKVDDFVIDVFDPEKHKIEDDKAEWSDEDFLEEDELMKQLGFNKDFTVKDDLSRHSAWNKPPSSNPDGGCKTTTSKNKTWNDDFDDLDRVLDLQGPGLSSISGGKVGLNLNMDGLSRDLAKIHSSDQSTDLLNDYDSDDDISLDYDGFMEDEAAEFDPSYAKQSNIMPLKSAVSKKEELVNEVLSAGLIVHKDPKPGENLTELLDIAPEVFKQNSSVEAEGSINHFEVYQFEPQLEFIAQDCKQIKIDQFINNLRQHLGIENTKSKEPAEKQKKDDKHKSLGLLQEEPTLEEFKPSFGELLPCKSFQTKCNLTISNQDTGFDIKFDARKDEYDDCLGPNPAMILQALTMSNASDGINLERLETVGDSFLKYAVTAYLYCVCEKIHEGKLSYLRSRQISNFNLFRLGREKRLGELMIATKFEPNDNWLPPTFVIPKGLEKALVDLSLDGSNVYSIESLKDVILSQQMSGDQLRAEIEKRKSQCILKGAATNNDSDDEGEKLAKSATSHRGKLDYIPYNLLTQQSIPDKSIADCVEALIGAYLICAGPKGALLFMKWLGLKVMPDNLHELNQDSSDPIWRWLPRVESPLIYSDAIDEKEKLFVDGSSEDVKLNKQAALNKLDELYLSIGLDRFEDQVLNYRFKDKSYLVQAFTHNSFYDNYVTDCYQRLEFLGDAVLDFLITRYLYEDPAKHSPGILTDLRSALVNNTFFASLAVKYNFHKYLKLLSSDLFKVISNFVNKFNQNTEQFFSSSNAFLYVAEGECERNEDIEVPKALGDIFESVAGAIFLDSGMSLDAVWKVYYAMMKPEIEYFSKNVPKSPIRELLEMKPQNVKFGKAELLTDTKKIAVCVEVFGEGKFIGIGRNKRLAKCTAAKKALRYLNQKDRFDI